MTKALPFDNAEKMSEEEWLTFINSQTFFDFMHEMDKAVPLIAQIIPQIEKFSLATLSKIFMVLSHFDEFNETSLELADAINKYIESEIIQATNLTFTKPVTLFEFCIGFVNMSRRFPEIGKWQNLLVKKLKESIRSLSHSYKLVAIWKLSLFNSDYFDGFMPLLLDIADKGPGGLNFYEKNLLNQLVSFCPGLERQHNSAEVKEKISKLKQQLTSMTSDPLFAEQLKDYELENICREAMTLQDFTRAIGSLESHFEEETQAKVKFNHVVFTDLGQAFFVPIYIEKLKICVLILNDGPGKDSRYQEIAKCNAFGLGQAGFNVKYVSLSSLLDRTGDEDYIRLDNIDKVRRELVRNILQK